MLKLHENFVRVLCIYMYTNLFFLFAVSLLSMVSDIDLRCFVYTGYGKDFVKKHKMSPDAWMQMAYQLTFYR